MVSPCPAAAAGPGGGLADLLLEEVVHGVRVPVEVLAVRVGAPAEMVAQLSAMKL